MTFVKDYFLFRKTSSNMGTALNLYLAVGLMAIGNELFRQTCGVWCADRSQAYLQNPYETFLFVTSYRSSPLPVVHYSIVDIFCQHSGL